MEFIEHKTAKGTVVVSSEQDALDIMANIGYLYDSSKIILQKFSNYRVQLVVIGDFPQLASKSLKEFILESNKGLQVNFLSTISELL